MLSPVVRGCCIIWSLIENHVPLQKHRMWIKEIEICSNFWVWKFMEPTLEFLHLKKVIHASNYPSHIFWGLLSWDLMYIVQIEREAAFSDNKILLKRMIYSRWKDMK